MNQLLEQIYETGRVEDAEGNSINPFPIATPSDTGTILYEIVKKYSLEKTLEVGMAYGLSTLFICQAHDERGCGNHIAIDPFQTKKWKSIGVLNVKRSGLEDRFRLIEAPSFEALPSLLQEEAKLDFAFIDGMHKFDYALLDFFYVDKLLSPGGYVAFDDLWMPAIRKVIAFVLRNRAYELVKFEARSGFQKQTGRILQRFFQNPFEQHTTAVKLIPENICLLRKVSDDKRKWDFHRSF